VYLNRESVGYYTPTLYGISLLLLGYKSVQLVTVLNTVGNCNTMVRIVFGLETTVVYAVRR